MHCLDDRIKAAEVSVIPGLCSLYFFWGFKCRLIMKCNQFGC